MWHSHKASFLLPVRKSPERTDISTGHWLCQTKGLIQPFSPIPAVCLYTLLLLGVTLNWGLHMSSLLSPKPMKNKRHLMIAVVPLNLILHYSQKGLNIHHACLCMCVCV